MPELVAGLDDFWADNARCLTKSKRQGQDTPWECPPPIRRPPVHYDYMKAKKWMEQSQYDELSDLILQSTPLEDDSWADPQTQARHYSSQPWQTESRGMSEMMDDWADQLLPRQGNVGRQLAASVRPPGAPVLEDDSWADRLQRRSALAAEKSDSSTATGSVACQGSTSLADSVQVVAETKEDVRTEVQESSAKRNGRFDAPDVPLEYVTFSGRVLQFHATDPAAEDAFKAAFCKTRFHAACPSAAEKNLPLLTGLDFEWKPDKRPSDNHPIAVMQVACWDTAFIIRTAGCSVLPNWLREFLESGNDIVKVTAAFDLADKQKLRSSFGWEFGDQATESSYVDIATLADARSVPHGMRKMAGFFDLPMLKLKAVGCSNWAAKGSLTAQQKEYAADDPFFQLFLLGKLLLYRSPDEKEVQLQQILVSWQSMEEAMQRSLKKVDNSNYRRGFFELRDVVRDAVDVLSKALGSGGCTNLNDLNTYKTVQKSIASLQKTCPGLQLNAHFLRQSPDYFVIFFRDELMRVRLRVPDDEYDQDLDDAVEPEDISDEDAAKLVEEVIELMVKYEPPVEKRRTVMHRAIPEHFWIPARAILSRQQSQRFEQCSKRAEASIESVYDGDDGLLLRLLRHPRAPDDTQHMERCVKIVCDELKLSEEEAKKRLTSDEKFMQFWSLLRTVEVESQEEASIARSLSARSRILVDAERLAVRISPPVTWEVAKEGLEKVKWYRQLLGECMAAGELGKVNRAAPESKMQDCLNAIITAWPNVAQVTAQKVNQQRAKREAAEEADGAPAPKKQMAGGKKAKNRKH